MYIRIVRTSLYIAVILCFSSCFVLAQQAEKLIHIGTSANAYKGDLNDAYQKWTSSLHLGLKLNHSKTINGHLAVSLGNVSGQNPNFVPSTDQRGNPENFFNTRLFTFQYDLQVNLLRWKNLTVYVSQGVGMTRFDPRNQFNESLVEAFHTRAPNEGYNQVAVILPSQIGLIYLFDNGFGVGLQAGYLNTQTDYIDNISQLGNKEGNDNILMYKFQFYIPVRFKTPETP
jgi:hypothetical protein